MPSVLFESTDTDAPVLDQSQGAMINVLRACLVTGYGSKSPLGWEEVYYDAANYKWVVRQKESKAHRPYIRISDDNSEYGADETNAIQLYDIMYDIDTGINKIPDPTSLAYYSPTFSKAYNSTAVDWKIVGDAYGFWLLVRYFQNHTTSTFRDIWTPHYIGDYINWVLDYKFPFVLLTRGYYHDFHNDNTYGQKPILCRNLDNSVISGGKRCYFISDGFETVFGNMPNTDNRGNAYFGGSVAYTSLYLLEYPKYDDSKIGVFPGAYFPMLPSDIPGTVWGVQQFSIHSITLSASSYLLQFQIRHYGSDPSATGGRMAILVGEGFRNVF